MHPTLVWSLLAALVAGCGGLPRAPDDLPTTSSPDLANAPAGAGDSESQRRAAMERTARADLECNDLHTVAELDRRYSNGTVVRYVVEGCGKRGLYVETCDLQCRYLLVSIVPVRVAAPPTPAS